MQSSVNLENKSSEAIAVLEAPLTDTRICAFAWCSLSLSLKTNISLMFSSPSTFPDHRSFQTNINVYNLAKYNLHTNVYNLAKYNLHTYNGGTHCDKHWFLAVPLQNRNLIIYSAIWLTGNAFLWLYFCSYHQ